MGYEQQIQKVMKYIERHLDENLSLDVLSEVACLSKFHFHRLFSAYCDISLLQYVRWLRLKRAAHQLVIKKDLSIIQIAMGAGFESHEAFSRAFKKACGLTPQAFRQGCYLHYWERTPYQLPKQGDNEMNVNIENKEAVRLAVVEHRGDPKQVSKSIDTLIAWAKAQPTDLKPKAGEAFCIAYNDPNTVVPEEFSSDFGIKIPSNIQPSGDLVEKILPAGRYAIAIHYGSRNNIADTVYAMYRDWLPKSNEQLGDFPCVFCYQNFDHDTAETGLITECRLLLA